MDDNRLTEIASGIASKYGLGGDPIVVTNPFHAIGDVAPQDAAKAAKAGRLFGTGPDYTVENLRRLRDTENEHAWTGFMQNSPEIAKWAAQNKINAALAKDDPEGLGFFEKSWRAMKGGFTGNLRGKDLSRIEGAMESLAALDKLDEMESKGQNILELRASGTLGDPLTDFHAQMSPEQRKVARDEYQAQIAENFVEQLSRAEDLKKLYPSKAFQRIQNAKGAWETLKEMALNPGAFVGEGIGGALGGMAVELPFVMAGGAAGGVRGLASTTFLSSYGQEYGAGIADVLDEMNVNFRDKEAVKAAIRSDKFKELMSAKKKRALTVGAIDAATAGLVGVKISARPLRQVAAQTGIGAVGGGAGEIAGSIAEGKDFRWADVFLEMAAEGIGAIPEVGSYQINKLMTDGRKAKETLRATQEVQELFDAAKNVKMREQDAGTFQQMVKSLPGGIKELYIDPADIDAMGPEGEALKQALPSVAAQYENASALGGSIVIPTDEALAVVPGSAFEQALIRHVRTSEDSPSIADVEKQGNEAAQKLKVMAEKALADGPRRKKFKSEAETIYGNVLDELNATGKNTPDVNKAYAALTRDFFVVMAGRMGRTPAQLFEQYRLRVTRQETPGALSQAEPDRLARAQAQGFDTATTWYHGTPHGNDIRAFDLGRTGQTTGSTERAVFLTDNPDVANAYSMTEQVTMDDQGARTETLGGSVYPLLVRHGKQLDASGMVESYDRATFDSIIDMARKDGFDSVDFGVVVDVPGADVQTGPRGRVVAVLNPENIRSRNAQFAEGGSGLLNQSWYRSALADSVSQLSKSADKGGMIDPKQAKARLLSMQRDGKFKQDELQWSGLLEWLDMQPAGKVAVADIERFVRENGVQVQEVEKGAPEAKEDAQAALEAAGYVVDGGDISRENEDGDLEGVDPWNLPTRELQDAAAVLHGGEGYAGGRTPKSNTKYASYQLPGGENYRELLLTLPVKQKDTNGYTAELIAPADDMGLGEWQVMDGDRFVGSPVTSYTKENAIQTAVNRESREKPTGYRSSHWDEPNILAHIRFNERTDADGRRVLFIEELQSDWGQAAKKNGIRDKQEEELERLVAKRDAAPEAERASIQQQINELGSQAPGVANAPFIGKTESWVALALKRMIAYAAENGFDRVAFINGEQSADRYDLSKQVEEIQVFRHPDGDSYDVSARTKGERNLVDIATGISAGALSETIGKDLAEKAASQSPKSWQTFAGLDLKVGGEGMRAFYDKIVPNVAKDVLKKIGGERLGTASIFNDEYTIEYDDGSRAQESMTRDEAEEAASDRGGKVVPVAVGDQVSFDITDKMREAVAQGLPLFQRSGSQPRAQYAPDHKTIILLKDANLSSYLHELGHFFLDVTTELAVSENAPQQIKDDMAALMKWFGVESVEKFRAMDIDEQRQHHEKWADAFEQYLFEGKAPSAELQPLFSRFRDWMKSVYRSLQDFFALRGEPGLTDEVRGVMDRMIADDEAIAEMRAIRDFSPLFEDKESAGMSDERWGDYQALRQKEESEAQDKLHARSLKDMQWLANAKSKILRALQKDAAGKRKLVKEEVTQEVMAEPVYAAREQYSTGEAKIDIASIEELFAGEGDRYALFDWSSLAKGGKKRIAGHDGVPVQIAAAEFDGFESAEQFIRALVESPPASEVIELRTNQRMLERYGDITSQQVLEAAADEAIHNKAHTRMLATELAALDAEIGTPSFIARAATVLASQIIDGMQVGSIKPARFSAAASRAGIKAMSAWSRGNREAAAENKRVQVIQSKATELAYEAVTEVEKGLRYLGKFGKDSVRKGLRGEYVEQIDALREKYDLRKSAQPSEKNLRAFLVEQAENGTIPADIPAYILDGAAKPYSALTMSEFRGLVDSVRQLEKMARQENQMYLAIKNMNYQQEKSAILDRVRQFNPDAFNEDGTPKRLEADRVPTISKAIATGADTANASMLSPETIISVMEGGEMGQLHASLFGRLSDRSNWKSAKMQEVSKRVASFFEPYTMAERAMFAIRDIGKDTVGISLTRENVIAAVMLYGNKEGRQRLKNEGWDDATMQKIVNLLDKKDFDLINNLWKFFDEEMWPELKELNERTIGKAPPKVEAVSFETKHGTARGGYMPIAYDRDVSTRRPGGTDIQTLGSRLSGQYAGLKTHQGTSQERVEEVRENLRVRLDLNVVSDAISDTIHDLAYREAIADMAKLLRDGDIQTAIKQTAGTKAYDALMKWAADVAAPTYVPDSFGSKAVARLRRNATVTMLSGVSTALLNITGLVPAMTRVNPAVLLAEFSGFLARPFRGQEPTKFVFEQSGYMRNRFREYDRDLNHGLRQFTKNKDILPSAAVALALMGMVDRSVSVSVWRSAYKKGLKLHGNNDAAVQFADHVVRQTQGAGRDVDLPSMLRTHNEWYKIVTMFSSYMNSQYNQIYRSSAVFRQDVKNHGRSMAVAKFTGRLLLLWMIPSALTVVIREAAGGGGNDDRELSEKVMQAVFLYPFQMIPMVRDVASFSYQQYVEGTPKYGYQFTPLESGVKTLVETPASVDDILDGEGDNKDIEKLIMGAGFATGIPGATLRDVYRWTNGEEK